MGYSTEKISTLVDLVSRKKLVLPEMQRRYVWLSTQVRDLFDSLYRGYPVGSILVWERPLEQVEGRELDVGETAGRSHEVTSELLLDGQQRLTSLTAILNNQDLLVRGRKKSLDILFNVTHPDVEEEVGLEGTEVDDDDDEEIENDSLDFEQKTFVVETRKVLSQPNWISLRKVFREDAISIWMTVVKEMGLDMTSPEAKKISDRIIKLQKIKDIEIPIVKLDSSMDYRTVTDVFCRVNSAGSRLKGSDLALAQITSRWSGSLKRFEEFQRKFADDGRPLFDLGFVVRALVVFTTGQCKFLTISSIPVEKLEEGWRATTDALDTAIDVVKSWGVTSFSLLSAPSLVITVAYILKAMKDSNRAISAHDMNALKYWLLVGSICGHYSKGSTESIMDQDLAAVRCGKSIGELTAVFAKQGWTGVISTDDIKGKYHGSAYFGLMYLVMRELGAKDWTLHTQINLASSGSALKVQFHHIWPQARLKAYGEYDASEINEIANLAFIGGHTNRRISASPMDEYLPQIPEDYRRAQCVPLDETLYPIDRYRDFIAARRDMIVRCLNDYLNAFKI